MSGGFEVDFIGLALVFLAAFIGAVIANRIRQSMIVGYIATGLILGIAAMEFPDAIGSHIFQVDEFISLDERQLRPSLELMADLGLTFLLFFIGLEFSVSKLKRAGKPSLVIAVSHLAFNMFAGAMIGAMFGWDWKSTFFLAATLSMSSLGVAAKSLIELRRLDREETEYMLGSMIVEDFMTMVLLTLAMGTVAAGTLADGSTGSALMQSVRGALVVYSVFIALALWLMPYLSRWFEKVKNDEVFTLLALACVLGSAALAYYYGLPFMIGAFFIGMAFAETRISDRLQLRLLSFRDAFVAIFFVTFGLQIALGSLAEALGPIVLGITFVLVNEMFLVSSVGYLLGFNSRGAASLGASLLGRGGDSILFASIGGGLETTNAAGETVKMLPKSDQLYPFSGGLSLVTNFMVPVAIRKSVTMAVGLGHVLPRWVIFSGAAIGRAMRPAIIHKRQPGEPREWALTMLPIVMVVGALVAIYGAIFNIFELISVGAIVYLGGLAAMYVPLRRLMARTLVGADMGSLGFKVKKLQVVVTYAPIATILLLTIPVVVTTLWNLQWWFSPIGALWVVVCVLVMGWGAHRGAVASDKHPPGRKHVKRHLKDQKSRMKERYRQKD
jgi:CPA2 family monovalent cation:H+ antiporter-2